MLRSYGDQVESPLLSCGRTCTDLGIGSERKGRPEKFAKFSFYVKVECEIFTCLKYKK